MLLLRDYKYIDVARITDYLSSVDPGVSGELTQRIRSNTGLDISGGINIQAFKLGGGARKGDESEVQQTVRVYAQHMFNRLYEEVQNAGSVKTIDVDTPLEMDGLSKSSVLEITRDFRPSPLHQMLDSFTGVMDKLEFLGMADVLEDELEDETDMQQVMKIIGMLRGEAGNTEVPMFSKAEEAGHASVVFVARENFVLGTGTEFRGEMSLFGKVQELIPVGSSIDLLDLLRVLPPGVRDTGAFGSEFKEEIRTLMSGWPEEFGGPIDTNEAIIEGPVVVMTPVAAYSV